MLLGCKVVRTQERIVHALFVGNFYLFLYRIACRFLMVSWAEYGKYASF